MSHRFHLSGRPGTRGGRGPKIAVPTRTMVAPSSTAISKSPLIPIDSSGSPWRSASLRSERNQPRASSARSRSEEHTSELQSLAYLVCRLLLEKKKKKTDARHGILLFDGLSPPP